MSEVTINERIYLALNALFTRYLNGIKMDTGTLPTVDFDPPWPSPCIQEEPDQPEQSANAAQESPQFWRPVERHHNLLFSGLEQALEFTFKPEITAFYGSYWSNGLCVKHDRLDFNLIQIWNEEDEERLKENLLGHAFAKLKARLPMTYFIGCNDGNDAISLDHDSGQVVLEKPGKRAHRILSENLETFLLDLHPTSDPYT